MKIKILLSILLCPITLLACWAYIPIEKLVKDADLIVSGKIIDVGYHKDKPEKSLSKLQITKILKNKTEHTHKVDDIILLESDSQIRSTISIVYKKDQYGVWLLDSEKTYYTAYFPEKFQPIKNENKISELIKNKP